MKIQWSALFHRVTITKQDRLHAGLCLDNKQQRQQLHAINTTISVLTAVLQVNLSQLDPSRLSFFIDFVSEA